MKKYLFIIALLLFPKSTSADIFIQNLNVPGNSTPNNALTFNGQVMTFNGAIMIFTHS